MHTLPARTLLFAVALSALAGCVDAIGFVQLGGYFVSFMSGNTTRLAVGLRSGDWGAAETLASLITSFVAGAALGAAVHHGAAANRKSAVVLTLATALLLLAASLDGSGRTFPAMLIVAAAMGAVNFTLHSGDSVIGVTYMTGALVKLGQRVAASLQGDDPHACLPHLVLWLGLMAGGVAGATLVGRFGGDALWFAFGWGGLLSLLQWRR